MERKEFPPQDPRLDWRSAHDPASENYPIRPKLGAIEPKPKDWRTGSVLDQGREGACVGFGWTADLIAAPRPDPYCTASSGNTYARNVYYEARRIDEWPGESYEGTSVLAGAKVVQARGFIGSYRWCFGIEDVRDAVIAEGPVVIGIPWYSQMYDTRPSGLVEVGGDLVGGHCLVLTGYHPGMRITGEDWDARFHVFKWRNSWGESYGRHGSGYIRYEDLRDLLADWGEACVPQDRTLTRLN
jgi:hypothetical protein